MTEKEISRIKEDNFNNEHTIEKFQRDFRVFDEKIKALEAENKELQCVNSEMKHRIDCLESEKRELRLRCKESVRDNFDNHLYALLNIVGAEELHTKFELPAEPIKVAEMLIYATERKYNCMTGNEYDKPVFEKWQLEQIARHLLVYCGKYEE